jgi:hypothetical protein
MLLELNVAEKWNFCRELINCYPEKIKTHTAILGDLTLIGTIRIVED